MIFKISEITLILLIKNYFVVNKVAIYSFF